jgi:hypothetical protein
MMQVLLAIGNREPGPQEQPLYGAGKPVEGHQPKKNSNRISTTQNH